MEAVDASPAAASSASDAAAAAPAPCARAGLIVRPGVLYGPRYVRSLRLTLPLQWIGAPLAAVCNTQLVASLLRLPLLGPLLTPLLLPPTPVSALAESLVRGMTEPDARGVRVLTVGEFAV